MITVELCMYCKDIKKFGGPGELNRSVSKESVL